jgi:hypothetical protein
MATSKEWFKISEIDYYSAFIKLWLSFNAFYKALYQDDTSLRTDRQYLEKLKVSDNRIKRQFIRFLEPSDSNEAIEFRYFLQLFIRRFGGDIIGSQKIIKDAEKGIRPQINGNAVPELSFQDFIHPRNFQLKKNNVKGYLKIDRLYIREAPDSLWELYLEIIYMTRNMLVHGILEPTEENHELVKSVYIMLRHLIKDKV